MTRIVPDCPWFWWHEAQQKANPKLGFPKPVPVPDEYRKNVIQHAEVCLIPFRRYLGIPVRITSWYRGPAYNKACGGAKASTHLTAKGTDLEVDGFTGPEIMEIFLKLRKKGLVKLGGLGVYDNHPLMCHVDTRRLWGWVTTWPKDPKQVLSL